MHSTRDAWPYRRQLDRVSAGGRVNDCHSGHFVNSIGTHASDESLSGYRKFLTQP